MASWNQAVPDLSAAWLSFLVRAMNQRAYAVGVLAGRIPLAYQAVDGGGNVVWSIPAGSDVQNHELWKQMQLTLLDLVGSFVNSAHPIDPTTAPYLNYLGTLSDSTHTPLFPGAPVQEFRRKRPREALNPGQPTVTPLDGPASTIVSGLGSGGLFATIVAPGVYTAGDTITISNCVPADYNGIFTVTTGGVGTFTYALASPPAYPILTPMDTEGNQLAVGMLAQVPDDAGKTMIGRFVVPIPDPNGVPVVTGSPKGGYIPAGDYFVQYAWWNGMGETLPSPEAVVTITDIPAKGSITFRDLAADGDTLTLDGFTFTFSVAGGFFGGPGSTVTLTEPTAPINISFVQRDPVDVANNVMGQLSNSVYTSSFTATQTGTRIDLTQVIASADQNSPIVSLSAAGRPGNLFGNIFTHDFSGGTFNEGSLEVTVPALPAKATHAVIYLGAGSGAEVFGDITTVRKCRVLRYDYPAPSPSPANRTQWEPAPDGSVADILDSYAAAPNTVRDPYAFCLPGDYIGEWIFIQLRYILNLMTKIGVRVGAIPRINNFVLNPFESGATRAIAEANASAAYAVEVPSVSPAGAFPIRSKSYNFVGSGTAQIIGRWCQLSYVNHLNFGLFRRPFWYAKATPAFTAFDAQGDAWPVANRMALWSVDAINNADTLTSTQTFASAEPPNWPAGNGEIGYYVSALSAVLDFDVAGGFNDLPSSP